MSTTQSSLPESDATSNKVISNTSPYKSAKCGSVRRIHNRLTLEERFSLIHKGYQVYNHQQGPSVKSEFEKRAVTVVFRTAESDNCEETESDHTDFKKSGKSASPHNHRSSLDERFSLIHKGCQVTEQQQSSFEIRVVNVFQIGSGSGEKSSNHFKNSGC